MEKQQVINNLINWKLGPLSFARYLPMSKEDKSYYLVAEDSFENSDFWLGEDMIVEFFIPESCLYIHENDAIFICKILNIYDFMTLTPIFIEWARSTLGIRRIIKYVSWASLRWNALSCDHGELFVTRVPAFSGWAAR